MLHSLVTPGSLGNIVLDWVGVGALALEILAAALIIITVVSATVRYGASILDARRYGVQTERYKKDVAGGMMLSLEVLVAADILLTIVMEFALEAVITLALLILIRVFLMWSLIVETEHRWPWQKPVEANPEGVATPEH